MTSYQKRYNPGSSCSDSGRQVSRRWLLADSAARAPFGESADSAEHEHSDSRASRRISGRQQSTRTTSVTSTIATMISDSSAAPLGAGSDRRGGGDGGGGGGELGGGEAVACGAALGGLPAE